MLALNVEAIRGQFPALGQIVGDHPAIFLDNPGGTQVHQSVIEATTDYYLRANANHGGQFVTSHRNDDIIGQARVAMADFLNATTPQEIVFGPNMTNLTFNLSRAIGRTLSPGDEATAPP